MMTPNRTQLDKDIDEAMRRVEETHAEGLRHMEEDRDHQYVIPSPTQEDYNRSERIYKNSHSLYPPE